MSLRTKVINDPVVTNLGHAIGCSWVDFDDDGFIDLFVSNQAENNRLYRNLKNGTFLSITNEPPVLDGGSSRGCSWGDFDNDGWIDLFVGNIFDQNNFLYRNLGGGRFQKITEGKIVTDGGYSNGSSWGDYDQDGFLDLVVANAVGDHNFLYHNQGDGTFLSISNSPIVAGINNSMGVSWGDYNGDGRIDLFVANGGSFSANANELFQNTGDGFVKITGTYIVTNATGSMACEWGDFDNDLDLDLFVANGSKNELHRNNGDGTFTTMSNLPAINEGGESRGCAWGDYDNDGFLDLYVANGNSAANHLYWNKGDGTFMQLNFFSEGGDCVGCAWGDYDNDGFLDLIVANGYNTAVPCLLYRNNGNSNHWLRVKCVGSVSNRSGIGAKVRIRASIGGSLMWQLREITSGDARAGNLEAHFGLRDASLVDVLQVQWPSGKTQELHNLTVDQRLKVIEPPELSVIGRETNGMLQFRLTGGTGLVYTLATSTDLVHWSDRLYVTNTSRTMICVDDITGGGATRFYRGLAHETAF